MGIKVNPKGNSKARKLISAGEVDTTSSWSFSASDGNALLGEGGDDWKTYGTFHLAVDDSAEPDTKEHYKYPFGKNGKVYRSGVRAIRTRAAQQGETDIFDAAGKLMEMMDEGEDSMEAATIERRIIRVTNLEMRAGGDGEGAKITGYAARFNELSDDLGGFREKIAPGAFKNTIKQDDIRALFNHDPNYVLGRTLAGTLNLYEDKKGLRMEVSVPETTWAKDLTVSIERGDISQQSFGFNTLRDEWDETNKDDIQRTLREVRLFDVGPVTYPAYPQTSVQMRSLSQVFERCGIDVQLVQKVLLRVEHNLEIRGDDRRAIDDVIAKLKTIADQLQEHEEGDQSELDQRPSHRVELMRRRLELKLK